MRFDTYIQGIPCQCKVTLYSEPVAMKVTGTGFGDATPPEEEEFEFQILDRTGTPAPWLVKKLDNHDYPRLLNEFKSQLFKTSKTL